MSNVAKFPQRKKGDALQRAIKQVESGAVPMIAFTVEGRKIVVISDEFSGADVFTAAAFRAVLEADAWAGSWS